METTLMIVTIIALALALGMSGVAWRLLRDNKHRTAARVEALRSLADEEAAPEDELDESLADSRVPEFRRPEVQMPRFSEIEPVRTRTPERRPSRNARRADPIDEIDELDVERSEPEWDVHIPASGIAFAATVAAPAAPKGRWLALAAVGVAMAGIVSVVYAVYRPVLAAESGESPATETAAAAPVVRRGGPRPIELLSLRHQADPDGTFTITGLVQNPAEGSPVRQVMAVVYLFDREGNYFASGKALLDFTLLQPGDESPFVIRVPGVSRVSRYRVGFRSQEGGIVAHVDRRGQLPGGTTGDAVDAPVRSPSTRRSDTP